MSIAWRGLALGALLATTGCSSIGSTWDSVTGGTPASMTNTGAPAASGGYLRPVLNGTPVAGTTALAPAARPAGGAAGASPYLAPAGTGALGPTEGRPPVSGATAIADTLAGPKAIVTERLAALGYERYPTPAPEAIPMPGERSLPTGYDRLVRSAYEPAPSMEMDLFPDWSSSLRW